MPPGRVGLYWTVCFTRPVLIGFPVMAIALALAWRAYALRAALVGALAGLGAGLMTDAGWRTFCHVSDPVHVLSAHLAAVLALSGVGAAIAALLDLTAALTIPFSTFRGGVMVDNRFGWRQPMPRWVSRFPCAAVRIGAGAEDRASGLKELADAEQAFAKLSLAKGVAHSFHENFAEDGIGFSPQPVKVKAEMAKRPPLDLAKPGRFSIGIRC